MRIRFLPSNSKIKMSPQRRKTARIFAIRLEICIFDSNKTDVKSISEKVCVLKNMLEA